MRGIVGTSCGLAAALLLSASPANGAEIVGSSLAGTPGIRASSSTSFQDTAVTNSPYPLVATASGVIVAVRQRWAGTGADPGQLGFRVLTPAGGTDFTARVPLRIPNFTPAPNNAAGGIATIIPVNATGRPQGEPIAAGERLARRQVGGTPADTPFVRDAAGAGGVVRSVAALHDTGTMTYADTTATRDNLLQFTVEPDADGDAYGDESQDRCLGDPSNVCEQPKIETRTEFVPQPVPGPVQTRTIACRLGTRPTAARNACEKIKCRTGRKLSGSTCVRIKCRKGRKLRGNRCVKVKKKKRSASRRT